MTSIDLKEIKREEKVEVKKKNIERSTENRVSIGSLIESFSGRGSKVVLRNEHEKIVGIKNSRLKKVEKVEKVWDSLFVDRSFDLKKGCDFLSDKNSYVTREQISSLLSILEYNLKSGMENKRRKKLSKIALIKLQSIKSVKGIRQKLGYPSNGQRTKTNGKTARRMRVKIGSLGFFL